jgi:hypothetical protein
MNCCESSTQTVADLLHSALARPRWRVPAAAGMAEDRAQDLRVEIYLGIENGRVCRIDYRCTTCAALIAYCEALVRQTCGVGVVEAAELNAGDLVRRVGGVPVYRQDRAHLVVAALRNALAEDLFHPDRSER